MAGMRRDGSLRTPVIVWVVRLGDDLYTRSVNGPDAAWFRGAQVRHRGQLIGSTVACARSTSTSSTEVDDRGVDDEIDAAYQRKYGRYPGPVKSITSPTARSTTLKLDPPTDASGPAMAAVREHTPTRRMALARCGSTHFMTHLAMWEAPDPASGRPRPSGATTSPTTGTAFPRACNCDDQRHRPSATTTNCSPVTSRR